MWLLIDGILDYLELALIKDNKVVAKTKEKQNKNLTKILIPNISNFLKENNVDKKDIERIFVINGPGSFTCVKLISVFANTFKSIYPNVQLFSLNSNWWFASQNKTISLIDAKSNLNFCSIIDLDNKQNKTVNLIKCDEEKQLYKDLNFNIYKHSLDALKDIEIRWEFNKDLFEPTEKIIPLYVKEAV